MTASVPRTILLVEDNAVDIDLTRRAFARRNAAHTIRVARDGEEALEHAAEWEAGDLPPAVILLDIRLPKLDGLEVLRHLKARPASRRIPVIMLTASEQERDVATAYLLGANSYIVKPVDYDKFAMVMDAIDRYWVALNETSR